MCDLTIDISSSKWNVNISNQKLDILLNFFLLRYETNVFSTGKLKGCQKGKKNWSRQKINIIWILTKQVAVLVKKKTGLLILFPESLRVKQVQIQKRHWLISLHLSFENYLISIAADLHVYLLKYFGRNTTFSWVFKGKNTDR